MQGPPGIDIDEIRRLAVEMDQAILDGKITKFRTLAKKRRERLQALCDRNTDSDALKSVLQESIDQDKDWLEKAAQVINDTRSKLDEIFKTKHGVRQIGQAYDHSSSQSVYYSRPS